MMNKEKDLERFIASSKQVAQYYECLYKELSKYLKGHKELKNNYLMIAMEIKKAPLN